MTNLLQFNDLRGYQQRGVSELHDHGTMLGVVPMGGGKTATALTAIAELIEGGYIRCALVLAPKRVAQLVWPKEPGLWEHLQHLKVSVGLGPANKRRAALFDDRCHIRVQTIDNLQWLVEELKQLPPDHELYDLLVIDEMSKFKNPRGKRAKALMKVRGRIGNVWGLTGTPRPNGYEDLFMPMRILTNGEVWGHSFDKWRNTYMVQTDFHGYKFAVNPMLLEQLDADTAPYMYTVGADDMPELPPLTVQYHHADTPDATLAHYKLMEEEMVANLHKDPITAANAAVKTAKLEQLSQGFLYDNSLSGAYERYDTAKADLVFDLIENAGGPVIVPYWYAPDLELLKGKYGKELAVLGSETSDKDAERAEAEWNKGNIDILALHPASAGHGLNLQYGGDQFIWMMPIWSAELWDQTLKRIHRPGKTTPVFAHVVMASIPANTIDIDAIKVDRVINKMSAQDAFVKALRERGRAI